MSSEVCVFKKTTPKPGGETMRHLAKWVMAASAVLLAAAGAADAQVTELRIGYQPSPLQDASVAMFETWGAKNGVKIVKVPNSYGVYVEKMTASLTSNSDQYDVIWHNDDWGQTWAHLLEPTDDVDANKYADKWGMAPVVFANAQGQNTVVPMGQTFSVFFDRSDLVKPAYDRNEANAVFMGGDAAFTVADSLWWSTFNDPAKSKIAGKVAAARFPLGPNRTQPFAWDDIWGWAIPKSIAPERKKLAKKMLEAMMLDEEGQVKLWKATGAPPPNTQFWPKIAEADPFMRLLKEAVLDSPDKVRGAYYFPQWPAVHKPFNDTVTKAVTGKREDIAQVLAEGAPIG